MSDNIKESLKLFEEELQDSEERFRATFEQAAVGIAHVSLEGSFLRINKKFCDIVGFSPEEMFQRTFQDITYPEDLDADLEYVKQLLSGEIAHYSMEKRYIRKDGELVWVHLTVSLVRNEAGRLRWFVSVVKDISNRKLIERKLQDSEEKYRTLIDQVNAGIVVVQDGKIKFVNKYLADLLGFSREDLLNSDFTDHLLPEELPKIADIYRRRMNGEDVLSVYESTILHNDGSCVDVEFNAGMTTYGGKPADLVIVRDITAHKQMEANLRASQADFKALYRNALVALFRVEPEGGKPIAANKHAAELFGYGSIEEFKEGFQSVKHYANPEDREAVLQEIKEKGFIDRIVMRSRKTDGTLIWNEASFRLDPETGYVDCASIDITERMQSEERILKYQQRLKALALQLTLAEEKERRNIAADLHDHIGHSLALARMQLSAVLEAASQTERTLLVNDISNILLEAIHDAKNLIFELSSPLMNEIGLAVAISEWLEEYLERRYGMETELIDEGGDISLDVDLRAILFRNVRELFTNIIKHAKAKKVSVFIENSAEEYIITITDDGSGFDPEAVSQEVKQEKGFGLFSIQERMSDLGGSLEILSEPGKGSKIIMSVPLDKNNIKKKA